MKVLIIAALAIFAPNNLSAKARIPIGEREALNVVYDLPNTDEFKLENGNYVDLATLHEEYNVTYILPLYVTKEPRLVGYDEKAKSYYNLPESDLKAILAEYKLDEKKLNQLPFYTRYGAKLIVLLLIAFLIWGNIPSKKAKITPTQV